MSVLRIKIEISLDGVEDYNNAVDIERRFSGGTFLQRHKAFEKEFDKAVQEIRNTLDEIKREKRVQLTKTVLPVHN